MNRFAERENHEDHYIYQAMIKMGHLYITLIAAVKYNVFNTFKKQLAILLGLLLNYVEMEINT